VRAPFAGAPLADLATVVADLATPAAPPARVPGWQPVAGAAARVARGGPTTTVPVSTAAATPRSRGPRSYRASAAALAPRLMS
jgi:hypothetical protein